MPLAFFFTGNGHPSLTLDKPVMPVLPALISRNRQVFENASILDSVPVSSMIRESTPRQ